MSYKDDEGWDNSKGERKEEKLEEREKSELYF